MANLNTSIDVCGELVVRIGDADCTHLLPGRQGRLAVAYLAVNRGVAVRREELIIALWGEDASPQHAQALSVILSKLRRVLGDGALENTGGRGLRLAQVTIDLEDAESAHDALRVASAEEAWPTVLETGTRIAAMAARGVLPGEDARWLDEPRRRLEAIGVEAREHVVDAGLAVGGPHVSTAARMAEELVTVAPFRESGYVGLMRVRTAEGNVAEALRVFDRLRTVLREELGVAPGPRAQAELEKLLRQESSPRHEVAPAAMFATRSSGVFVGRRAELDVLRELFTRAAAGRGQLVLVEGEPGIGKTRLALQAVAACEAQGAVGLYGRCDVESLVPYQPFVEALRHAASRLGPDRLRAWAEQYDGELARVVPELGANPRAPSARDGGRDDADRYRLFEAVAQALVGVARAQPVVLVLDDLHWADRPTLLLLRQLARSTERAPMLVLATYRDAERPPELIDAIVHLRREHFLEQLSLTGLNQSDTARLVGQIGSGRVSEQVSHGLWTETRGNPFFLEEIVRHLESTGEASDLWPLQHDLPEGVREVIGRRMDALSEPTRRTLAHAAVIGREFDLDLLDAVGPAHDDELDDVVDEAVHAQLIVELGDRYGRCGFAHALIRQVLYESLTHTRRARLHLRVAEALERLEVSSGGSRLAELAHHFVLAPPSRGASKAAEYAERAARQATEMLAYEEAARLYSLALRALESGPDDPARRGALLLALGDVQSKAADVRGARATFLKACNMARARDDTRALACAALGYGAVAQMSGGVVDATVVDLLEEALTALEDGHVPLRARLLARLAMELSFAGQRQRRVAISAQALELARSADDPSALGIALVSRHWSLWGPDNVQDRLAAADELIALAQRTGDERLALHGHRWRMIDTLELGDIAAAEAASEVFIRHAEERSRTAELTYVPLLRATLSLLAGDLDAAARYSHEAMAIGERIGGETNVEQAHVLQLLILRRERGGLEALEGTVTDCARRFSAIPGWRCALAFLHALIGRREEANAAIVALAEDDLAALPVDGLWLGAVALLADTAALLGDAQHAELFYDRLLPYADRNVPLGWVSACTGSASRPLGLLAGLLGRPDAAARHFEAALAKNAQMGARGWLARTQYEYATHLLGRDERRADALLSESRALAEELRMPVLTGQIEVARRRPRAA